MTGICEDLEAGRGEMRQHILELEDVIRSPILLEEEGGAGQALVEQIVVSLTRLCSSILLSPSTDHKTASQFVRLLDCCLSSPLMVHSASWTLTRGRLRSSYTTVTWAVRDALKIRHIQ